MNALLLLIGSPMTAEVMLIITGIAVVLYFFFRKVLFERKERTLTSYIAPAIFAMFLAPFCWFIIVVTIAGLVH